MVLLSTSNVRTLFAGLILCICAVNVFMLFSVDCDNVGKCDNLRKKTKKENNPYIEQIGSIRPGRKYDPYIEQIGSIRPGRKYAVFGSSILGGERSMNYAFDVPLSVLAWRRIGFASLVIITGDPGRCGNVTKAAYVMDTLRGMDDVVLLIIKNVNVNYTVTISQISRLFAVSLIQDGGDPVTWDNTYLVTADADIWPIATEEAFSLPPGKDILHGDGGPVFIVNITAPMHAPISYIGMKVNTWRDVMTRSGQLRLPRTTTDIMDYVKGIFGAGCCIGRLVRHSGEDWGVDQSTISLRLYEWKLESNRSQRVHVYHRDFNRDRVERAWWDGHTIEGRVDAHLLQHCYKPETWARMRNLVKLMHPDKKTRLWCDQYASTFNNINAIC